MECIVNKANKYTLCFVDIVGNDELFSASLTVKKNTCNIFVYVNAELYVVSSEKKYFTEYDRSYVYITKDDHVCDMMIIFVFDYKTSMRVKKGETRRAEQ